MWEKIYLVSWEWEQQDGWRGQIKRSATKVVGDETVEVRLKDRKETDYLPVFLGLIFT